MYPTVKKEVLIPNLSPNSAYLKEISMLFSSTIHYDIALGAMLSIKSTTSLGALPIGIYFILALKKPEVKGVYRTLVPLKEKSVPVFTAAQPQSLYIVPVLYVLRKFLPLCENTSCIRLGTTLIFTF